MLDEPAIGGEILVDGKVRVVRAVFSSRTRCTIHLEHRDGEPSVIVLGPDGEIL